MWFRISLCLSVALLAAACFEPYKKTDAEERKPLRNVAAEPTFQAFIGRLRIAVRKKDAPMMASLMMPEFGYSWDQSGQPGAEVFDYWDKNQLWPVLNDLLERRFVPKESYMVSPPEFVTDPNYTGPRCGMFNFNGSWRFAYFLPQE